MRELFPFEMRTKRTLLRAIALEDAAGWKSFNNKIAVRMEKEGLHWPRVPSITYARNEILNYMDMRKKAQGYVYSIIDRKTGEIIGDFHLKDIDAKRGRAEFGHALTPEVWGTGITYETLDAVRKAAAQARFSLWAKIAEENVRSWKSLEKYKATFKGRRVATVDGVKKTVRVYEL